MESNSWLHLQREEPRYRLPEGLRQNDAFGARDCGWVEQMQPFIRDFTSPGQRVLDPFCGFGSTLVAASLEGRAGIGIELDEARVRLTRERFAALGMGEPVVSCNDAVGGMASLRDVDLLLSNLPYFGCPFPGERSEAQLYHAETYAAYLLRLRDVFLAAKQCLKPGGHIVLMVQNLDLGAHMLPQAWDVARLLAERFTLLEERVLIYDRERRAERTTARANRAHEYALVAVSSPRPIDLDYTRSCLRALQAHEPESVVFGSFARWLRDSEHTTLPSDADLMLTSDPESLRRVAAWLETQGFQLECWGAPISASAVSTAVSDRHYLSARRLDALGRLCLIDVYFGAGSDAFQRTWAQSECVQGIRVAGMT